MAVLLKRGDDRATTPGTRGTRGDVVVPAVGTRIVRRCRLGVDR
jgi:hypothetical protein